MPWTAGWRGDAQGFPEQTFDASFDPATYLVVVVDGTGDYAGLSNARVESVNTKLRLLTRIALGFRSPEALVALTMLNLSGPCPPLPGRPTT